MKYFKFLLALIFFCISCTDTGNRKIRSGEELAKTYCGSCHLFPDPALLDKVTWKEKVLPPMAKQLGIDNIFETTLPNQEPVITVSEWKSILDYYIGAAPAKMPGQERPPVEAFTKRFIAKKIMVTKGNLPATSFIKIDEGNHWIYAANAFDSSVNIFNEQLKLISHRVIGKTLVDIDFTTPLLQAGQRNGVLTSIGMMNPNDRQTGGADIFDIDRKGNLLTKTTLFDSLPRPVQITRHDLDGDGRPDYLVCGFGNTKGALFWMRASNGNGFEKKVLSPFPGAIRSYIDDLNRDGLPDIIVLMAQAQEGIFIFINKGNGIFETKKILAFPPIYGSSFFDLVDFNQDGYKDLLYTCGDNADYSSGVLKYYHGIYIFMNDGKNNFSQKYFFPVHGCYKAIARDFDKDGDLDIAAISFFPDGENQPKESFIYLEQTNRFHFLPYTIADFNEGNWMTMDAGDIDGDCYGDIVLGSLVPPVPDRIEEWKNSNRQKTVILLLHNETGKIRKTQ